MAVQARKGSKGSSNGDFSFERKKKSYRFTFKDRELELRDDQLWQVALPAVGGLVVAASVIGPLIIGFVFTAVAFSAALAAGAIFTSLFLPFFILIAMGALFWGGVTFSAFAALGSALLLPKIIGLGLSFAGFGAAALLVGGLLKPIADSKRAARRGGKDDDDDEDSDDDEGDGGAYASSKAGKRKGAKGRTIDVEAEPAVDPELLERDRQLRDFDELLKQREQQRLQDKWRQERMGGGSSRRF